jgi:predicted transcriptional regulator
MTTRSRRICVKDVMKREFTFINRKATVYDALLLMKQKRTSVLVVERGHVDDEYGILLISSIARNVLALDKSSRRVNVYEVMEKPAIALELDMDIRYCSRLFARFDLVRALVLDNGQVVGTISPNALVLDGLFSLEQAMEEDSSRSD